MNTITTTRPGPLRRAWLTVRLWSLIFRIDSAERYLAEAHRHGITEGRNLTEYHRQIDAMVAEARAVADELDS